VVAVPDALLWYAVRALLPGADGAASADRADGAGAPPADVLDVGGGTGGLAVPLAALGHRVTVVDPSPDALAALARRASESGVEGLIVARQADADDLQVDDASFDLALCHGVLEHVDEPSTALAGIARALRPGARLSLLAAQRSAAVIGAALAGHLARAQTLLDDPEGRWGDHDPLVRRFDRARIVALVESAGLEVDGVEGVRVLADLVSGQLLETDPTAPARLHDLDARLLGAPDYAGLSASLHVRAHRPAPSGRRPRTAE
jgi:2-polyprenyl-3-methyl-5-hydroxy-6-metoxy-1,4-benzoquinol methylase